MNFLFGFLICWSKFSSLGILNFLLRYRTPKIIFYVLNNNFSYIQFFFSSLERFLVRSRWHWHFFSFPSSERFLYLPRSFFCFFSFFLQKDFGTFQVLLFKAFLFIFIILIYHFYICIQKNNEIFLIVIHQYLYVQKSICKKIFFIGIKNKL